MSFSTFNLKKALVQALEAADILQPTDIQQKCIPLVLAGNNVVGQSKTGSGKTLAFGLPMLEMVKPGHGVQALVLTPTRELCVQVCDALDQFGSAVGVNTTSAYGGVGIFPQIKAISNADVVIGTPGRILDHMERGTLKLDHIKFVVLDEVDRMSDMGFIRDVERILEEMPDSRQTLLFSATISADVHKLVKKYVDSPVVVKAEVYVAKHLLKQSYYDIQSHEKFSVLVHLLKQNQKGLTLIFCGMRHEVDSVVRNLKAQGIHTLAIHGGLTQSKRLHALDLLKKEKINVLVATDVAARGLDIKNVNFVYNYDVPRTAEEYVHRIGRTARAGEAGQAVTLLTARDHDAFRRVLRDHTLEIHKETAPVVEQIRFERGSRGFSGPSRGGFGGRGGFGSRGGGSRGGFGERRGYSPREGSRGGYGARSSESRGYGGPRKEYGSREGGPRREYSAGPRREYGSREGRSYGDRPSYGGREGGYRSEGPREGGYARRDRPQREGYSREGSRDSAERPPRKTMRRFNRTSR